MIEKPEALKRYEQAESLHIPYVDGGLLDQPYIWMQEHGVVLNYMKEKKILEDNQTAFMANNSGKPKPKFTIR